MKKLSTWLVVALLCLCAQLSFSQSQVKRQYQDELFAETTVVIKEDDSDDLEVLNNNFDMDDVGMGQVIRITTERDRPAPSAEVAPQAEVAAPKVVEVAQRPVQQKTVAAKPAPAPNKTAIGAPVAAKQKEYRSSGNYPPKPKGYRGNWSNKRVKSKRKRSKGNKGAKCYRF